MDETHETVPHRSDIERHMRSMEDQELQRVIAFNRDGYSEVALEVARVELQRRSVSALSAEAYLQQFPGERLTETGFCASCTEETTDESPGGIHLEVSLGAFGTSLAGDENPCAACGSMIQTKRLWIFVPIVRRGRYRVIYPGRPWGHLAGTGNVPFVGRRLRR